MLIRPSTADLRLVGFYTGKVLAGIALLQVVPLVMAIALGKHDDVTSLSIGIALALGLWQLSDWRLHTSRNLNWSNGMVVVASSWLVGAAVIAVPLYLSGHYDAMVDAYFDAMSGLTTSGLSLVQDLDHVSTPMHLLRHLSQFAGGQGIIIVVLTLMGSAAGRLSTLYVGEGRDERVVPNVIQTARFIFLVAGIYLAVGSAALFVANLVAGLEPVRALFHAVTIFMAAFDTGGFAPYSSSIAYYHSAAVEAVIIVLMIAGTLSFGVHHALWRRQHRRVFHDLEVHTIGVTFALTLGVTLLGLAVAGAYTDLSGLLRKGVFTVVSAHTGTGFGVNAGRLFVTDWGLAAPAGVVAAMALGGMAGSTAGGIKAARVSLAVKSVMRDVRRAVQPDAAIVVASVTKHDRRVIRDEQVRSAVTIIVLFLLLYIGGALVGVYHGIPFDAALFESTSASANVGLSAGVLTPDLPLDLKLVYTAQMWLGRLEFMAAFVLLGYGIALFRGRI